MIVKSKKVNIKVRDDLPLLPGKDRTELNYKIGSFGMNGEVGRGLNAEEEKKYLPSILGLNPDSVNWDTATRNYWASISVKIPYPEGLSLEIGKQYKDAEDKVGTYLNVADYVLYKFCLNHSKVANDKELLHKSTNIHFYIEDLEKENKKKKSLMEVKMKAYELLTREQTNDKFLTGILLVLGDKYRHYYDVNSMTLEDKLPCVNDMLEKYPNDFVALGKDKSALEWLAFLILAINANLLVRLPNTEIIMFEEDGESRELGSTYTKAIMYLQAEQNREFTRRIETKLNFKIGLKQESNN